MQSTGHSSMQALSFTSTHGSAMTYVTTRGPLGLHSGAGTAPGVLRSHSMHTGARRRHLGCPHTEVLAADADIGFPPCCDSPTPGPGSLSLIHISEPTRRTPISYAV